MRGRTSSGLLSSTANTWDSKQQCQIKRLTVFADSLQGEFPKVGTAALLASVASHTRTVIARLGRVCSCRFSPTTNLLLQLCAGLHPAALQVPNNMPAVLVACPQTAAGAFFVVATGTC